MSKRTLPQGQRSNGRRWFIIATFVVLAIVGPLVLARSEDTAVSTTITYLLDWSWGSATENEAGWAVTNDLGYQIQVTDGSLVSYTAELLECNPASLADWLQPATAYAGHGEEISEVRTTKPLLESLSQPTAVRLETRTVAATAYCQLHYLVGQHPDTAAYSLAISGSYLAPEAETAVPFTFQTDLAWGKNHPLATEIKATETAVSVTIQRDLSQLFNGITFEHDSQTDLEKALLRNLINNTEIIMSN